ncbi:MAG TPA: type II toxin-antitoxin system prevent-host-death family antitoxin [Rhizomicrobium sp.]|nr:type II toxin-antitoxin system prevent-host-death family antitoxin [Rhizomicrobium sp.]
MTRVVKFEDVKDRLNELVRKAEAGETTTITRDGKPVASIVPIRTKPKGGTDWEAGYRFMEEHGIDFAVGELPPDWDDPLPEDFLITPLPEDYGKPKSPKK